MYLKQLSLIQFKNYSEIKLDFDAQINCFVGPNGAGKTNLLDALYYLSFCKSYFNPVDSQNVRHGDEFFVIEGWYDRKDRPEHLYVGVKKGQKKSVRRNKKEYSRISEHIGHFPLVMISPADRDLILEGSDVRRKFMDGVIAQSNKRYLDDLLQYNRVLQQRNSLLKYFAANRRFDEASLEIYDEQLNPLAERIHEDRAQFLSKFIPIFQTYYQDISGGAEEVSIEYQTKLSEKNLQTVLFECRDRDRSLQYTSQGIHKDDLNFTLREHSVKKTGSQGQQKTFLIALKLAQFSFLKELTEITPILLLDDIFDKLDHQRVGALIRMVEEHRFGQIFISDTHYDRTEEIVRQFNESYQMFRVDKNQVQ